MDPKIDEYIQQNRGRYTRTAIRAQLISAGHDAGAVDEALDRVGVQDAVTPPVGWRPRWTTFLVLAGLGAVGAAVVWSGQPYGSGVIAPIVYLVIVSIGFASAKAISVMIDAGASTIAIVLLGLGAVGGGVIAAIGGPSLLIVGLAAFAAVLALLMLFLRSRNPRAMGTIGAALPILAWLVITGTCYAPLAAVTQPGSNGTSTTMRPGHMKLHIDPPLAFDGSGSALCQFFPDGSFTVTAAMGSIDGHDVSLSAFTLPPNPSVQPSNGQATVGLAIGILDIPGDASGYGNSGSDAFSMHAAADGSSGTSRFEGLKKGPNGEFGPVAITGTATWTCDMNSQPIGSGGP